MHDSRLDSVVRWRWLGGTALGVLATLAACVIDDSGPTSTELYRLIDTHCSSATACDCTWTQADEDTCTVELEARWKARLSEGQRRELQYDAECLASLTTQIEDRDCYWPGGASPLCESFCAVFHGDRAEGERCEGNDHLVSDCAQGLLCQEGTCTAPCAALGGRQRGEPCANDMFGEYDDCAAGLWCSWSSGLCERQATQGQPCSSGECGEGLTCRWQTGTCEAAAGAGQSCDENECAAGLYCEWLGNGAYCQPYAEEGDNCYQRSCADELWCNENDRCVPAPAAGQPCLWGSVCADQTLCDFATSTCVALPELDEPCVQSTCATGSWCDTADVPEGICAARVANDEMCAGHRQCQSNYCPNGFCWARPGDGESCEGAGVCAEGLVCNGTTCEPTITRAPATCSYPGW